MSKRKTNLTEDERCRILADYLDSPMSVWRIAAKHGVSISYPSVLARRSGFDPRSPGQLAYREKRALLRSKRDWLFVGSVRVKRGRGGHASGPTKKAPVIADRGRV